MIHRLTSVGGRRRRPIGLLLAAVLLAANSGASVEESAKGFVDPPLVFDAIGVRQHYERDGTGRSVITIRARPLNEAGVQQLGQIVVPYLSSRSSVELTYLRVVQPDQTALEGDAEKVRRLPAPVAAAFPVYSDLYLFHAPAPALAPGDLLEYEIVEALHSPDTPGAFSTSHAFNRDFPVEEETLEIDVPADLEVKLWSRNGLEPEISEEGGRRVYRWGRANKEFSTEEVETPDVELSSFASWDAVADRFLELAEARARPTPETRRLAQRITAEASNDLDRLSALFRHVATEYRYLGLSLGVARYQPQFAEDVIANGYGDCKDKHTLLSALLSAAGFEAYPAAISTSRTVVEEVPALSQFDHLITVVRLDDEWVWLDATGQVTPFRYLGPQLRGKKALVMGLEGGAELMTAPEKLPFAAVEEFDVQGEVNEQGELLGEVTYISRGDGEVALRSALFSSSPTLRDQIADSIVATALSSRLEVTEFLTTGLTETSEPLKLTFGIRHPEYLSPLNTDQEVNHYLMQVRLPSADDEEEALDLGPPVTLRSSFSLRLPPGFEARAPAGSSMSAGFGSYLTEYDVAGDRITARRTVEILQSEVAVGDFRQYEAYRKTLRSDDQQQFRVRQSGEAQASRAAAAGTEDLFAAGSELFKSKSYAEAAELFSQVVAAEPEHPKAWLELGKSLMRDDRTDEAVEALRRQVEIDPHLEHAYGNLGWALDEADDSEGAMAAFRKQLELYPLDRYSHAQLGRLLSLEDNCDEAVGHLETALSLRESDTRSRSRLGGCLLQLDRIAEAREVLEELLEASQSAWDFTNAGHWAHEALEFELAETLLRKAIELDPGEAAPYNELGLVLEELARFEEAVAAFESQVEVEPDSRVAHENRGRVLRLLGRHAEAIEALERHLEIRPDDPFARHELGLALEGLGETERAVEVYMEQMKMEPSDILTLGRLVKLRPGSEEVQALVLDAAKSARLGGDGDVELMEAEAIGLVQNERCDEALPLLQEIVKEAPQSRVGYRGLAVCFFNLSLADEALAAGIKALAQNPDDPYVNRLVGLVHSQHGRYREALPFLERAKANFPGAFPDQDVLDFVKSQVE